MFGSDPFRAVAWRHYAPLLPPYPSSGAYPARRDSPQDIEKFLKSGAHKESSAVGAACPANFRNGGDLPCGPNRSVTSSIKETRTSFMLPRFADLALNLLIGVTIVMATLFLGLAISIASWPNGPLP